MNVMKFSAKDLDNDMADHNCAEQLDGGWWFTEDCGFVSLNGWPLYTGFNDYGLAGRPFVEKSRMMIKIAA